MRSRAVSLTAAQVAYDNRHPEDEDDDGLQPCPECEGECTLDTGEDCPECDGKGYFLGEDPCSAAEYERLVEDCRYG
jgi:RecJ-like exonuclease